MKKSIIFYFFFLFCNAIFFPAYASGLSNVEKGKQFAASLSNGNRIYGTFISAKNGTFSYRDYMGYLKSEQLINITQSGVFQENESFSFQTKENKKYSGEFIAEDEQFLYYSDDELKDIVQINKKVIDLNSLAHKQSQPNKSCSSINCSPSTASINTVATDLNRNITYINVKYRENDKDFQSPYIKSCVNKFPGKAVSVDEKYKENCYTTSGQGQNRIISNVSYGGDKKYQLKVEDGSVILTSKIQFKFKGEYRNWSQITANMIKIKRCISNFYEKNGIKTRLTFYYDLGNNQTDADHLVNLWDNVDRANSENWATLLEKEVSLPEDERCRLATHEFGHLLGLIDEYEDDKCHNRKIFRDNSIMGGDIHTNKAVRLNERHIGMILSPLCDKL